MPTDDAAARLPAPRRQRRVERISQATIEVRVSDADVSFSQVRELIIDWLSLKAGAPLPEHMRLGGTGDLSTLGVQRVETAALNEPLYWSARQDDQDANFPRRTWVTEAALGRYNDQKLLIGHRLYCVTLGEQAPFSRSIPRFMREISRTFDTYLDDSRVHLSANIAKSEEDVDSLVDLMLDPRRRHPIICVSLDGELHTLSESIIDADKLANDVFGVAHVWKITRDASFVLTDRVGKELSVFNGAVRSWRSPFSIGDSGFSHPLALSRNIIEWQGKGPASFHKDLVDWALRFSAGRADAEDVLPPFSSVRQLVARLARERATAEGRSDKELLELALAENEKLSRELEDQKAEHKELLAMAENDIQRLQAERDEACAEVVNLRHRIATLEGALRNQRHEEEIPIPESLSQIGEWAQKYLGDGVRLLPRAISAAKKSPFEDVGFVYRVLLFLRDRYVPMRRLSTPMAKNDCDKALRELGLELTPSFSGPGAGQFGDEYKVKWNEKVRMLDSHLKGSNSRDPRYGFRLYFFWDEDLKAVVVGSLPGHLTTSVS